MRHHMLRRLILTLKRNLLIRRRSLKHDIRHPRLHHHILKRHPLRTCRTCRSKPHRRLSHLLRIHTLTKLHQTTRQRIRLTNNKTRIIHRINNSLSSLTISHQRQRSRFRSRLTINRHRRLQRRIRRPINTRNLRIRTRTRLRPRTRLRHIRLRHNNRLSLITRILMRHHMCRIRAPIVIAVVEVSLNGCCSFEDNIGCTFFELHITKIQCPCTVACCWISGKSIGCGCYRFRLGAVIGDLVQCASHLVFFTFDETVVGDRIGHSHLVFDLIGSESDWLIFSRSFATGGDGCRERACWIHERIWFFRVRDFHKRILLIALFNSNSCRTVEINSSIFFNSELSVS